MKQTLLVAFFAIAACLKTFSQTGYIYIHNKSINEANAIDFTCHITGGPTTVSDFVLNDRPDFLQTGDLGAGNKTGSGELWAITSSTTNQTGVDATGITGTIYHRLPGKAAWTAITTSGSASAVDGAGLNACVYISNQGATGSVYYYNGSVSYQIFVGNTGTFGTATDVSYANGKTAIVSSNGNVYIFTGSYAANNTTSNTGWAAQSGAGTGNANNRIDLNWDATSVALATPNSLNIRTIVLSSGTSTTRTINVNSGLTYVNGSTSSTISAAGTIDIAYDSTGAIYTLGNVQYVPCSGTGTTGIVFRLESGQTVWTEEGEGRGIVRLTGGAGGTAWGTCSVGFADAIWTRATDNTGAHVWIDDERVRTTVTNGNSVMIPVTAGTYTFKEDITNINYDLGRFNIYDPTGNSTGAPGTNSATINVAAGETVNIEVINELLVPKAIALNCNTQILQDFGTGSSSSNTEYGPAVEGTAYHYANSTSVQDGYYYLVHNLVPGTNWFTYTNSYTVSDHTPNDVNGYLLVVNASYAKDEFYRQRVTNLIPGLQYTISFYLANVLNCNPIKPNIKYGLQDLSGNVIVSSSTGDINTNGTWQQASFTFTATASTADLFLSNNNIGGLGNDVALDDISLNPVITTLGANEITPTIAPNLCINSVYTFSNSVTGGQWFTSNSSLASININTGVAVAKAAGTVIITYEYTNQVGCVSDTSRELNITAPPTLTVSDLLGGTSCLNQVDSLYSTATGTAAPFVYAWTASPTGNGLTNASVANTSALPTASGTYTYTVTATDQVGCSVTGSVNVAVSANVAPTVTLTSTGAACTGGSGNYQLTAGVTGGTSPFTYTWTGTPTGNGIVAVNANTTTASPTAAGSYTYTVKVKDQFCTVPVSKTVTAYASPAVTVSPGSGSVTLCTGGTIALASTPTGGSGTYTYAWSASGGAGNGLSGTPTTQNTSASPTSGGNYTYTVVVTDGNGCKATGNTVQNVSIGAGSAPTVSASASPTTLCAGSTVTLTGSATPLGITYTYSWSGPGPIASSTSASTTATPTTSGTYQLKVTGVLSGCSSSINTNFVTVNPAPVVSATNFSSVSCRTNSVDSLYSTVTSGTSPFTYAWAATTVPAGGSAVLANSAADTTSITSFNGDGNYTFTLTVTDSKACTATATTSITYKYSTGPAISNMPGAATLCLGSTVTLNPTVTAGTTYTAQTSNNTVTSGASSPGNTIDGNVSTFSQTTNSSGTRYIGLDFGSNNNKTIAFVSVYVPNSTAATALQSASVDRSSDNSNWTTLGTFPSSISSTPHWETLAVSNSTANRYIRISKTSTLTLYEVDYYSATTTSSSNTVLWTASPSTNGLASTSSLSTTAVPTAAGTYIYNVSVKDPIGCDNVASTGAQVVNAKPSVSPLSSNPAFCGTSTDSVKLFSNATGGTEPYASYAWTVAVTGGPGTAGFAPSNTDQNPTGGISGQTTATKVTFSVSVTDANGCVGTGSTSQMSVSNIPAITATAAANKLCPGQNITLTAKVTGTTTGPYTYTWTPSSNSDVTPATETNSGTTRTATATSTTSGNYLFGLAVSDANNCTATAQTATLAFLDAPSVTVDASNYSICANPVTTINLTATPTGGQGTYTGYAWVGSGVTTASTTVTSNTAKPTVSGVYTVTVTDGNGCTGTGSSPTVTVDAATPVVVSNCFSNGGANGTTPYVVLSEITGSSWLWTAATGSSRFFGSSALSVGSDGLTSTSATTYVTAKDSYTVSIVNSNGCKGSYVKVVDASTCSGIVLALAFDFTAQKQNGSVLLNWVTKAEQGGDRFDVERSGDGTNWQTIGSVAGLGGMVNQYKFSDAAPLTGPNYYRIKQVNANGNFGYSVVRTVRFTGEFVVHVYPNPATDFLVLEFNNDKDEKAAISIQTALGSTVFLKEQAVVKGLNRIKLNQIQPLAQGTYVITLATANNIYRSKFVKGSR